MLTISERITVASWRRFAIWLIALIAFSAWAFGMDSPWTRTLELAGGKLPEMQPGIPAIEPVRSLQALGANTSDYLLWQVLDIPYALMNVMLAWTGLGLGIKALHLQSSVLRFLMYLPPVYFVCELVENTLVAMFASGALPPSEGFVLVQQFATTTKFTTSAPAMILALAGAAVAGVIAILNKVRKSS